MRDYEQLRDENKYYEALIKAINDQRRKERQVVQVFVGFVVFVEERHKIKFIATKKKL